MKKINNCLIIGLIIFMIGINGCQDNKIPVQSDSVVSIDGNEKSAVESLNRFKIKHDEIARYIAENPVSIPKETWAALLENSKPISYYQLDEIFDETYFADNGNEYKFMIEIYSGSNIINPNEIRVSVDPDRFFLGSIDLSPTTIVEYDSYLHASSEPLGYQKVTTSHVMREKVSYLQIFVTAEQVIYEEPIKERQIYTGRTPCPECIYEYYLSIISVEIINKQDASNDEYEIFWKTGTGNFPSTTTRRFNGDYHTDAAGRSRYFADVNQEETYNMALPIAIARLYDDNTAARIISIEDDNEAGCYVNFLGNGNPDRLRLETWVHTSQNNPFIQNHYINRCDWTWYDEDDNYNSACTNFTKSNMAQYTVNNPLIIEAGSISYGLIRETITIVQ